ncbi:MAG: prevent-host-death protein [Cyanobacteria bacterium J06597_1]
MFVSLKEAEHQLAELCDAAVRGQTVIITSDDGTSVQLVPIPAQKKGSPKFGSAKGKIRIADNFDDDL